MHEIKTLSFRVNLSVLVTKNVAVILTESPAKMTAIDLTKNSGDI